MSVFYSSFGSCFPTSYLSYWYISTQKKSRTIAHVSDVAPGAAVSIPVTVAEEDAYSFEVFAVNAVGEGPKTKLKNVWIGADTPNAPAPTLTYEDGMMKVEWNAVTTSVHGGFIDLEQLRYPVTRIDG